MVDQKTAVRLWDKYFSEKTPDTLKAALWSGWFPVKGDFSLVKPDGKEETLQSIYNAEVRKMDHDLLHL